MGGQRSDDTVAFRILDRGDNSTNHHPSGLWVVRSDHEWRWHWERLHDDSTHPPPAIPPVDFAAEMVLVLAVGDRPSSGYAVAIDRLVDGSDSLQVHASERRPDQYGRDSHGARVGDLCQVLSPYDVVATAARDGDLCLVLRIDNCCCTDHGGYRPARADT